MQERQTTPYLVECARQGTVVDETIGCAALGGTRARGAIQNPLNEIELAISKTQRPAPLNIPAEKARAIESQLIGMKEGETVVIGCGTGSHERFITIASPFIDEAHAALTCLGEGYFRVRDLGSINGTFVDVDGMMKEAGDGLVVGPGDRIRLGHENEITIPVEIGPLDGQRLSGVSMKLRDQRRGIPGEIRNDVELNSADVVRILYDQLMVVTPSAVDKIVDTFPATERAEARTALAIASQYAAADSFEAMYREYRDVAGQITNARLFVPARHSIAANLVYLNDYKESFNVPETTQDNIVTTSDIQAGTVVILDQVILDQLERAPQLARDVADHRVTLLMPAGFDVGINPFNATTHEEIANHTRRLLDAAREYQARQGGPLAEALQNVLQQPLRERLAEIESRAGLAPASLTSLIAVIKSPRERAGTSEDYSSETISRQLNGRAGLSTSELNRVLDSLHEGYRPMVREMIAQLSEVYSARSMTRVLRTQHQHIQKAAERNGIPEDRVFYIVPEPYKSYGMMTLAYQIANGVSADRFIDKLGEVPARNLGPNSMVVVLDDVAGSGASLLGVARTIRKTSASSYDGHIAICPIISTRIALAGRPGSDENNFIKMMEEDEKLHYLPGRVTSQFSQTRFMKGLDENSRSVATMLVGQLGYGGNALFSAFPYMAPDNNCDLWIQTRIAHHFTLNGNSVKSVGAAHYSAPAATKFENFFKTRVEHLTISCKQILEKTPAEVGEALGGLLDLSRELKALDKLQKSFGFERTEQLDSILGRMALLAITVAEHRFKVIASELKKLSVEENLHGIVDLYRSATTLTKALSGLQRLGFESAAVIKSIQDTVEPFRDQIREKLREQVTKTRDALKERREISLSEASAIQSTLETLEDCSRATGTKSALLKLLEESELKLKVLATEAKSKRFSELEAIWSRRAKGLQPNEILELQGGWEELKSLRGTVALNRPEQARLLALAEGLGAYQYYPVRLKRLQSALEAGFGSLTDLVMCQQGVAFLKNIADQFGFDFDADLERLSRQVLESVKSWSSGRRVYYRQVPNSLVNLKVLLDTCKSLSLNFEADYQELITNTARAGYNDQLQEAMHSLRNPNGISPQNLNQWQEFIHYLKNSGQYTDYDYLADMTRLTGLMIDNAQKYVDRVEMYSTSELDDFVVYVEAAQSKSKEMNIDQNGKYQSLLTNLNKRIQERDKPKPPPKTTTDPYSAEAKRRYANLFEFDEKSVEARWAPQELTYFITIRYGKPASGKTEETILATGPDPVVTHEVYEIAVSEVVRHDEFQDAIGAIRKGAAAVEGYKWSGGDDV